MRPRVSGQLAGAFDGVRPGTASVSERPELSTCPTKLVAPRGGLGK
jgi:hypothetical protein